MAIYPWDFHPDLQAGRLQLVAKVLRDTRKGALDDYKPAAGDTEWNLGCTAYMRSAQMLMKIGLELWTDWFKVVQEPLQFVFAIGAIPVRFYRGDAEDPQPKHVRVCEQEGVQLALLQENAVTDLIWRIAIETGMGGDVERLVLIGRTADGVTRCFYDIPADNVVALIKPVTPSKAPGTGIKLPPAAVKIKGSERKDDDDGKV